MDEVEQESSAGGRCKVGMFDMFDMSGAWWCCRFDFWQRMKGKCGKNTLRRTARCTLNKPHGGPSQTWCLCVEQSGVDVDFDTERALGLQSVLEEVIKHDSLLSMMASIKREDRWARIDLVDVGSLKAPFPRCVEVNGVLEFLEFCCLCYSEWSLFVWFWSNHLLFRSTC